MSSFGDRAEAFLDAASFDRGPWLAVAFASGIGLWFLLPSPRHWSIAVAAALVACGAARARWRNREDRALLLAAALAVGLALAAGIGLVWARSALVGAEPLAAPRFERIDGRIVERVEQPAEGRVRLTVAARDPDTGRALAYRINIDQKSDSRGLQEGARIRVAARLMPPSPPILPGAYNFARRAWFEGLSATGSAVGAVELIEAAPMGASGTATLQRRLSAHVRHRLAGTPGAIAATLASGDRGAIPSADEEAMRDAGLTHLLSISGLHVSAIIAAAYLLALRLLALWPWLALRVRLPLVAAGGAAVAGIGYTLLTGAEVPTVRSCIGAVLILAALALGREPLSLRMVAICAIAVLALWPESLVGPSFQMSFAAVIAIVGLHNLASIRAFLGPRDEGWPRKIGRRLAVLFLAGLVIELALMPIVLFHFHRAGIYGAAANVLAIPLVTFLSMPLVALALLFDLFGAGAPIWWMAGKTLELLLAIAHFFAAQPGAVKLAPDVGLAAILLFCAGGIWLALWQGRARLWGALPAGIAVAAMLGASAPDLLVTRDGRDIGVTGIATAIAPGGADDPRGRLLVLRQSEGGYAQDNLRELAAMPATPLALPQWRGARCSREFCAFILDRGGRRWSVLVARGRDLVEERALAAACERADIVVAARYLPRSCRPRWLKADRSFLAREGGLAIYLSGPRIETVARRQGEHGWWKPERRTPSSKQSSEMLRFSGTHRSSDAPKPRAQ